MIGASTSLVSDSTRQMAEATGTLGEVENSVEHTRSLILQISTATKEQALGISQVNDAVNQLDGVTQDNLGLVDAMNDAVQSQSQRSSVLQKSVGLFRLTGDASR